MRSREEWARAVNDLLVDDYAISIDDVGFSDEDALRWFYCEPDPRAFVDWFVTKYDLTSRAEIGLKRQVRFLAPS
jgi:hypothetical protein